MSFRVPTFNLLCNVWHGNPAAPPVGPPDLTDVPCQLAWPEDGYVLVPISSLIRHTMLLRVQAGTDVRGRASSTLQDCVELPSGSGRYYVLWEVDDVAKGFANEYRQGVLLASVQPVPLP